MDESYASSEDETDAMAQAMGFSSFGSQGPTKKRKFNPKTDAMVEGQELAALDRGGKKGQGSGGNKIPLGKPRVFGVTTKDNHEEIDLNDEDEDEDDEEPANVKPILPPSSKRDGSDEEEGPAYIDTSLPPPNGDARAAQQKIDAILANYTIPPMQPDLKIKVKPQVADASRGVGGFMYTLPGESRPPVPSAPASGAGVRSQMDRHEPRGRGQKNGLWYVGYYDPSFNENPWAKLEKANGLIPRGTWLERGG